MPTTMLRVIVVIAMLASRMASTTAAMLTVRGEREFRGLDSSSHNLTELSGHPAVVNFWATWCLPCKEEMPRLQSLSEQYRPQGVRFVAISVDNAESQPKIRGLISKRHFTIPVWTGATEATLTELQLDNILPATLIFDENGVIIGKIEGQARVKDITSRLDWLLNGRQGKQPKVLQRNDW